MKNQALFSSKDLGKKLKNVVCCNFCLALSGSRQLSWLQIRDNRDNI